MGPRDEGPHSDWHIRARLSTWPGAIARPAAPGGRPVPARDSWAARRATASDSRSAADHDRDGACIGMLSGCRRRARQL